MDADIPVPSEQKERTTFLYDLTTDFCLIDSMGNIVPNSQKTINEKFDYRRTVEDEHLKYLDWVQETLKLELKIKYPKTNYSPKQNDQSKSLWKDIIISPKTNIKIMHHALLSSEN
jgi:hypothetical protein